MSFWGAKVITSLFGAFPLIGKPLTQLLWGGFAVDAPTLNRFFSLHYLLPFVIAAVVALHIWALHVPGNANPTGVEVKSKDDTVPFHPYYTVKDMFAICVFMIMFAVFVFYMPEALGKVDNAVAADPLKTPAHIVPEWYLLPFYAILRAIPDKLLGVLALAGALGVLFIVPWLDTSKVRSMRYRPTTRTFFIFWVLACAALGWCGAQEPDGQLIQGVSGPMLIDYDINSVTWLSRIAAIYYFAYFAILPLMGLIETPLPVPDSLYTPVLSHPAGVPAGAAAAPETKG
jgi:quinol-cytochrome oxidoreductase complex cytochrome b subunit